MEQTPTPLTDRFIADQMTTEPFIALLELCALARRLERERAMLREALGNIMHYAGIGASVCDVDVTEQPQFVKARAALEATK